MARSASIRWDRAGGELRGLLSRAGVRAYLLVLFILAFVGWAFPLTDHVGYELAELIALAAGSLGASLGVAASRRARQLGGVSASARSLGAALVLSQLALLIPLAIALLDIVRRPACDPLASLPLYALLACPSALFACALGFLVAQVASRPAALILILIFLATLAVSLWPIWRGPQVFAFHHLGGMYPGPIYDEAVAITPALLWFRGATLLYALACAMLGLALAVRSGAAETIPRAAAFLLFLLALIPAALISRDAEALHFSATIAGIDSTLGGLIETPHLRLHVPREKPEIERKLLARDAEASVAEVLEFFDVANTNPQPIDVFLYRSSEEKRRLIGAADTSFTKPWLRQIHTNDAPAPHPILRHELVHALAADFAHGPFGVPGRWRGYLPDMAFIEGIAVAADWPAQESTVDEEAAALKKLGKLPDMVELFAPGRFYAEAGANAYTAAGSFVHYLWLQKKGAALRAAYGDAKGLESLGDLASFVRDYNAYLDGIELSPHILAIASLRFSQPSIVRKRCAHEVAERIHQAEEANAQGDEARAVELFQECTALEPDDPGLLMQERRALLGVAAPDKDRLEKAHALEEQILAHPKLAEPQRAQLLTDLGDAAWKSDDAALAGQRYAEAAALPAPEGQSRALAARQYALQDSARWPATRRLLAKNDAGPETWLLLRDLDLARPQEGFAAYLLARQAQNIHAWDSCLRFSGSALARDLPGPMFVSEALRMRALCGWRTGDDAAARRALLQLVREGSEAHRLEAERLLRRTP